jgi:hypothetical protein
MQKVWYRASKNAWYATILEGGRQKQVRLLKAPNDKHGRRLPPGATRGPLTGSAIPATPVNQDFH